MRTRSDSQPPCRPPYWRHSQGDRLHTRALVHDQTKAETLRKIAHEVVEADLEEPDTLDGAFAGGERPVAAYAAVAAGSFDELECNLCGAQRGSRPRRAHFGAQSGHDAPTRNGRLGRPYPRPPALLAVPDRGGS